MEFFVSQSQEHTEKKASYLKIQKSGKRMTKCPHEELPNHRGQAAETARGGEKFGLTFSKLPGLWSQECRGSSGGDTIWRWRSCGLETLRLTRVASIRRQNQS